MGQVMPYENNKGADQPAHPQSDQHLCCLLFGQYDMYTCYIQRLRIQDSFCSWADWFETYQVENPWRHIFVWCGSYEDYKVG